MADERWPPHGVEIYRERTGTWAYTIRVDERLCAEAAGFPDQEAAAKAGALRLRKLQIMGQLPRPSVPPPTAPTNVASCPTVRMLASTRARKWGDTAVWRSVRF